MHSNNLPLLTDFGGIASIVVAAPTWQGTTHSVPFPTLMKLRISKDLRTQYLLASSDPDPKFVHLLHWKQELLRKFVLYMNAMRVRVAAAA